MAKGLILKSGLVQENGSSDTLDASRLVLTGGGTAAATAKWPTVSAPTTPATGDMWADASGIYYRTSTTSVNLAAGGGGITAPYTLAGVGNTVPFTINAAAAQTANLQSWKIDSVEKAYMDRYGSIYLTGSYYAGTGGNGTFYGATFQTYPTANLGATLKGGLPAASTTGAIILDNFYALTTAGARLVSIRQGGAEIVYFDKDGTLHGTAVSGGVNWAIDSNVAYTAGKLLSVSNNGTEKAYFDFSGALTSPALTSSSLNATGSAILYVGTDAASGILEIGKNGTSTRIHGSDVNLGDLNNGTSIVLKSSFTDVRGTLGVAGDFAAYAGASFTAATFSGTISTAAISTSLGSASRDPYGCIAVTAPADANSYSYLGFTRAASIGMGMGISSSNDFWLGTSTAGHSGVASAVWFRANGSGAWVGANAIVHAGNIGSQSVSYAATAGSAPASDVSAWAKAGTKPSYAFNEISSAAISATSGSFSSTLASGALTVTGAITATGNITAYYSDARLKMGVYAIKSPLEKLMRLRGVSWVWDRDACLKAGFYPDSLEDTGVIAQEVQAVLPNAVGPAANPDFLAVKTSNQGIVALLIEAVKELKAEIESLKART
jgi:hypothetical protein